MKPLSCLLVLVLILAQVDDALAIAAVLPSAPLPDDSDEYLPAQPAVQEQEASRDHRPAFAFGVLPRDSSRRLVNGLWSQGKVISRSVCPLYALMSLQI